MPTNFDVVVVVVFVTVLPHHRVAKMTHPFLHGSPVSTKTRDFFFLYFPIETIFFLPGEQARRGDLGSNTTADTKIGCKGGHPNNYGLVSGIE